MNVSSKFFAYYLGICWRHENKMQLFGMPSEQWTFMCFHFVYEWPSMVSSISVGSIEFAILCIINNEDVHWRYCDNEVYMHFKYKHYQFILFYNCWRTGSYIYRIRCYFSQMLWFNWYEGEIAEGGKESFEVIELLCSI